MNTLETLLVTFKSDFFIYYLIILLLPCGIGAVGNYSWMFRSDDATIILLLLDVVNNVFFLKL